MERKRRMKIHFSKKEYQTLLEVLYIADWVLNAHREEEQEIKKNYKDLEQKIMAMAGEFGLSDLVERSAGIGNYFPSRKFLDESQITKPIEEFENATFWEELLERLARRDFIQEYGREAILKMSLEECFEKETKLQKEYDQEFSEHGLDRLMIHSKK